MHTKQKQQYNLSWAPTRCLGTADKPGGGSKMKATGVAPLASPRTAVSMRPCDRRASGAERLLVIPGTCFPVRRLAVWAESRAGLSSLLEASTVGQESWAVRTQYTVDAAYAPSHTLTASSHRCAQQPIPPPALRDKTTRQRQAATYCILCTAYEVLRGAVERAQRTGNRSPVGRHQLSLAPTSPAARPASECLACLRNAQVSWPARATTSPADNLHPSWGPPCLLQPLPSCPSAL